MKEQKYNIDVPSNIKNEEIDYINLLQTVESKINSFVLWGLIMSIVYIITKDHIRYFIYKKLSKDYNEEKTLKYTNGFIFGIEFLIIGYCGVAIIFYMIQNKILFT